MNIEKVNIVTFSPTGNSTNVAKSIAKGIKAPIKHLDITLPISESMEYGESINELTIFSIPVYAGRVPTVAANRIRKLKTSTVFSDNKPSGRKHPAVIVVTYGNRAYEDALRELGDIVSEVGFRPIAAAAFVGEHSWSVPAKPTAHGRPDTDDLREAEEFGEKILEKFLEADKCETLCSVEVPGTNPYSLAMGGHLSRFDFGEVTTPYTDEKMCIKCNRCVMVCPTGSIRNENLCSSPSPMVGYSVDVISTLDSSCIWCCACVKNCPSGARKMSSRILFSQEVLFKNYSDRKQPETYL